MALTDHCDVFASAHEEGMNRIVGHLMRQRPSLFNYGTAFFLLNPDRLCERIDAHPEVTRRGNPLISVEEPLPILGSGSSVGMDFCAQIVKLEVDLHPGNRFTLPPQLSPPLGDQRLAFHGRLCAGVGCPSREITEQFEVDVPPIEIGTSGPTGGALTHGFFDDVPTDEPRGPTRPIPWRELECFCLDLFAVLHAERRGDRLDWVLDGVELVDVEPTGLEDSLECYIATTLRVAILPRLRIAMDKVALDFGAWVSLVPTPISGDVPHNPSIADDELSVFLDLV